MLCIALCDILLLCATFVYPAVYTKTSEQNRVFDFVLFSSISFRSVSFRSVMLCFVSVPFLVLYVHENLNFSEVFSLKPNILFMSFSPFGYKYITFYIP